MRILLIGGSKSGKSMLAQSLVKALAQGGPMCYWATMEPTDEEDRARIARHITEREGWGFDTLECGKDLTRAIPQAAGFSVLMDSATAILANEMFGPEMDPEAGAKTAREILAVSEAVPNLVCVSDDLFRDGGQYEEWTDRYRRALAEICRTLAREFDVVCEVVAGVPKVYKGRLPKLGGTEE